MSDNQRVTLHRVDFTTLRNNLASYLDRIAKGEEIVVVDGRRGSTITSIKRAEKPQSK